MTKGGYYINMSSVDTAGYGDTLYYPHQEVVIDCKSYWLASPAALSPSNVMLVNCGNMVYNTHYECQDSYGYSGDYSVRPVVYLPSSVQLTEENNVWTVK